VKNDFEIVLIQGRNHSWKVEGYQGLGPDTKGRLGVGWVWGITPGKFLKTWMLNPAFWWLLAVRFLAFWKLRPRRWGGQYIVGSPNPKVGGTSLLWSLWLLRLCSYNLTRISNSKLRENTKRKLPECIAHLSITCANVVLYSHSFTLLEFELLELASCLIYARAFVEYICGCVLFQDVTVREIRGR